MKKKSSNFILSVSPFCVPPKTQPLQHTHTLLCSVQPKAFLLSPPPPVKFFPLPPLPPVGQKFSLSGWWGGGGGGPTGIILLLKTLHGICPSGPTIKALSFSGRVANFAEFFPDRAGGGFRRYVSFYPSVLIQGPKCPRNLCRLNEPRSSLSLSLSLSQSLSFSLYSLYSSAEL